VDITAYAQGALASALLADLGADVIKVEPPGDGDPSRGITAVWETSQIVEVGGRTHGLAFEFFNRNKRGIAIDLKRPAGREILGRLVANSDVLVHNYREATMRSLGLSYEELRPHNPALVYVWSSASGRGQDDDLGGFDITGLARSGFLDPLGTLGDAEGSEPVYPTGAYGDVMAATMTAFAALAGLYHRERTGEGQSILTSQLGSLAWLQYNNFTTYLATGQRPRRTRRDDQVNPLFNWYRCGDDRWMCLGMFRSDRHWGLLCAALGMLDLLDDPRFATPADRQEHRHELIALLDGIFATAGRDEWMARLAEAGLIVAPIRTVEDASRDDQLWENGYLRELEHDILGPVSYPVFPAEFPASPVSLRRRAPLLAEDSDDVLAALGYGEAELAVLRRDGVIAPGKEGEVR
jgi:formyl-CoA transferase